MLAQQQLLEAALVLPEEDRLDLAARLLDSVAPPGSDRTDAEWDAEIAKRLNELEAGQVQAIPWSEVRKRILR